ncbi:hypothetical protein ElyMa_002606800, partial [Elysia marginata]
ALNPKSEHQPLGFAISKPAMTKKIQVAPIVVDDGKDPAGAAESTGPKGGRKLTHLQRVKRVITGNLEKGFER